MPMRVIAANWKMNKSRAEVAAFLERFAAEYRPAPGVEAWIAPVAVHLAEVASRLAGSGVVVAAQNAHGEASGAFTGEIAAGQVVDVGAGGVILGHSERRTLFGETDAGVAWRLRGAMGAGLSAIVCVGEALEIRDAGRTLEVLGAQLDGSLDGFPPAAIERLRIAYEPIWAIGTGRRASAPQIDEAHGFVRGWLVKKFGYTPGSSVPILYGGSVKPETAAELLARPDVDGLLVGGASLEAESFLRLVAAGRQIAT